MTDGLPDWIIATLLAVLLGTLILLIRLTVPDRVQCALCRMRDAETVTPATQRDEPDLPLCSVCRESYYGDRK